jgi:hypothetical protein
MGSSGMGCRIGLVKMDVSEERIISHLQGRKSASKEKYY